MTLDRTPVRTLAELDALDADEIIEGYQAGLALEAEPGGNRSKAYWHGWRNGRLDRSAEYDADAAALAREFVRRKK